MGAVAAAVALLQVGSSYRFVRVTAACLLLGFGMTRLVSSRHPRWAQWSGMRVGFRDLTIILSYGFRSRRAGLMLLPIFLALAHSGRSSHVHSQATLSQPWTVAVAIHTLGYLAVTAAIGSHPLFCLTRLNGFPLAI